MSPRIRSRRPDDVEACAAILANVHAASGYPLCWPDDPCGWLTPRRLLAAWVAEDEDAVVGHVALKEPGPAAWAARGRLAAVTRLFVDPAATRRGAGTALVAVAVAEAERLGRRAALDVHEGDAAAIALYERLGWRLVATEPWQPPAGPAQLLRHYLAPER